MKIRELLRVLIPTVGVTKNLTMIALTFGPVWYQQFCALMLAAWSVLLVLQVQRFNKMRKVI